MPFDIDPIYVIYLFVALAAGLFFEGIYLLFFNARSYRKNVNRRLRLLDNEPDREGVLVQLRRERGLTMTGDYRLPLVALNRLILQSGLKLGIGKFAIYVVVLAMFAFGIYPGKNQFVQGVAMSVTLFGVVLMLAAGLSVFIALLNALEERRYDLAVMRMLGATPARLMGLMLLEGSLLAVAGGIAGLGLGHLMTEALGAALRQAQQAAVSGWAWSDEEWWLLAASLGVGILAALIPAWRAYRRDVAPVLAEG